MRHKFEVTAATWFGTGLIPPPKFVQGMAGTYGSLFALPLCWLMVTMVGWGEHSQPRAPLGNHTLYFMITFLLLAYGMFIVRIAEKALGPRRDFKGRLKLRDQNQIVIDEVVGMLFACYPLTLLETQTTWVGYLLAFGYFRFFDIVKVWPSRSFDRLHNSFGVMMDDVSAGIQAAILTSLTIVLLGL